MNILIADEHSLVRFGLRSLLSQCERCQVLASVDSWFELESWIQKNHSLAGPATIIVDFNIYAAAVERLNLSPGQGPNCVFRRVKFIALCGQCFPGCLSVQAIQQLDGLVGKYTAIDDILPCIEALRQNRRFVSAGLNNHAYGGAMLLSAREMQVLKHIALGHSAREIASDLSLSVETIKSHRKNLMKKLKVKRVGALILQACRSGFLRDIDIKDTPSLLDQHSC
ncbi:response regulator transcription factor [Agaribacterium haliotis]|uniref:response regulator transcription factor n=1 Tax=Agaribacterium haliotis TaxID=2013869 RepID=UPI000BB5636B|nr:response regulator transcription factor [Agaribacterium haliotis]